MKLVIQIPCYNEAQTLAEVLADLPAQITGVSQISVLVIDDGSSDGTAEVAFASGATHVVRHSSNRGLAASFATGIAASLALDADLIVNTDGDHQYPGASIADLLEPILGRHADFVIGDRRPATDRRNPWLKRQLYRVGRRWISYLAGRDLPDPVSGFRAYSRSAAQRLHTVTDFSYTIESLLQASHKGVGLAFVPIVTNPPTRPSRLFRSVPHFIFKSVATSLRVAFMYRPLATLLWVSAVLATVGVLPIIRFLILFLRGDGDGHVQSLVLAAALIVLAATTLIAGLLADLIAHNRRLLEKVLEQQQPRNIRWESDRSVLNPGPK